MPAAVTIPVATRLLSTYACQDMVEDLPDGISAGEGRRSSAGAHDQPPRPRGQLTPGGVGVRQKRRPRTSDLQARRVYSASRLPCRAVVKAERTGTTFADLSAPRNTVYAHAKLVLRRVPQLHWRRPRAAHVFAVAAGAAGKS